MIIKELMIYGYGKWVDQHFSFATPLQAIYGPNEAGKSTIIDFIESMFFGFQNKKQAVHGQFYPKTSKAYGGELIFEQDHQKYKLVRIDGPKGGNVKFYDIDHDIELPSTDFEALLSPIDRQSYNQLFYFGDFDKKRIL
ncbi:AAA family ATPase [Lentilactobacillus rapi]|uniref:AAA family ATPase n=1 Tax=Lentilactobacillus rapi TaxID=481723 RepID=UPI0006D0C016|nr:AAA family ATPase [Lentilactobacillus rapi]